LNLVEEWMRRYRATFSVIGVMALLSAGCGGIGSVANLGHTATRGRFASGSATGDYAIAQAAATAYDPGDLQVYVDASSAQQASVTVATTCLENAGGAGSKEQQKESVSVPAVVSVQYPRGSVQCIVAANSQLSQGGTVTVELFNGGAPTVASSSAAGNYGAASTVGLPTAPAPAASGTATVPGAGTSTGVPGSCSGQTVNLGDLGTWTVTGSGAGCATATSLLNQYENAGLRGDGTTQPLGSWECHLAKFVPFKPDTNDGYEKWECTRAAELVTFSTGNPALANSPAANTSSSAPPGFSSSGAGASGTVTGGSYAGVAKVSGDGPATDQQQCPGATAFSVDGGSPAATCTFAAAIYQVVQAAYQATGKYPAKVTTAGSPAYTATCIGGGDAGTTTAPPTELSCGDAAENLYVNIGLPLGG
jgi:hypothetical protein